MPRISRAARQLLEVVTTGNVEVVRRVRAPPELTPEQAEEFQRVVSQMPAEWFCLGHTALLCQYARHVIMARRIAQLIEQAMPDPDGGKKVEGLIQAQARETSIICRLMTRLRLTPQAVQPRGVSPKTVHEVESPWSGLKQIT
jgi:hypothetical protein